MAITEETRAALGGALESFDAFIDEFTDDRDRIREALGTVESEANTSHSWAQDVIDAINKIDVQNLLADVIQEAESSVGKARDLEDHIGDLDERIGAAESTVEGMADAVREMRGAVRALLEAEPDPLFGAPGSAPEPKYPTTNPQFAPNERVVVLSVGGEPRRGRVVDLGEAPYGGGYVPVRLDGETRTDQAQSDGWLATALRLESEYDAEQAKAAEEEHRLAMTYTGPATNVRFGWVLGDSEEDGPLLRCDVNDNGAWVTPVIGGERLAALLRDEGLSDVSFLEGRHVEVGREEGYPHYLIKRVLTAEEARASDKEKYDPATPTFEIEVNGVKHTLAAGTRLKGQSGNEYVVSRDGEIRHADGSPSVHGDDGILGEIIEPLAHDIWGVPLYAGDRVEFVGNGEHNPTRGAIVGSDTAKGCIGIRRDDGKTGNGPDDSWFFDPSGDGHRIEALEKVQYLAKALGTDAKGQPVYEGARVHVRGSANTAGAGEDLVGKVVGVADGEEDIIVVAIDDEPSMGGYYTKDRAKGWGVIPAGVTVL